ncbi:MAG: hypothetical protein QM500_12040, partial [Methylococcales bacterium]
GLALIAITISIVTNMSTPTSDIEFSNIDFDQPETLVESKNNLEQVPTNNNEFAFSQPVPIDESIQSAAAENSNLVNNNLDEQFVSNEEFINYRNSVAKVSQAELDVFLVLAKDNHDSILRIKRKEIDTTKIESLVNDKLSVLTRKLENMQASIDENAALVKKHEKNQGWLHNRVTKLEGGTIPWSNKTTSVSIKTKNKIKKKLGSQTKSRISSGRSQSLDWTIRGISDDRAFIRHKNKGRRMKVLLGTEIPGFGQVIKFDPKNERVYTTMGVIL